MGMGIPGSILAMSLRPPVPDPTSLSTEGGRAVHWTTGPGPNSPSQSPGTLGGALLGSLACAWDPRIRFNFAYKKNGSLLLTKSDTETGPNLHIESDLGNGFLAIDLLAIDLPDYPAV